MSKKKRWWRYFFRLKVVKQIHSPVNGLIQVITVFDKPRLMIGGMLQSGGLVKKIWDKAISKLKKEGKQVKNVLVVGLGCGDCAFEVQKHYPEAKITGVEIDEQVVEMAECFFDLATVKNLKIVVDDGEKYVEKLVARKKRPSFDLVIVDVYLGRKMPKVFIQKKFYMALKKLLNKNGVVAINHLFFGRHKKKAKEMIKKLDKVFKKISLQRTASNLVVFASL